MKYKIFLIIFILSLISSIILTLNSNTSICEPGKGCDIVNNSIYSTTFGIKNSIHGIFIFSFMILLTFLHIKRPNKHTKNILHLGIIIGSVIALYFL
ncbi:MAG: vitamin K epoxide reductase family protein, partial [Nanoarchaeota archaeon]